ncbi:MAG TPA: ABC transporter permease [Limnochordales bacterium]
MWFKIRAVWLRELLDSVRDKRTLYMMVLLPIVLMPLFILIGPAVLVRQQEALAEEVQVALVVGAEEFPELVAWIEATGALAIQTAPPGSDPKALQARLAERQVHLIVELPQDAAARLAAEQPVPVRVTLASGHSRSRMAAAVLETLLGRFGEALVAQRLAARGLSRELLEPFAVEIYDVTPEGQFAGRLLSIMVPFFIVVWAVAGGMYAAIDAGAGEKERNSLESLVMTPVPGVVIVAGKLLAVATIALVAVLLLTASAAGSLLYLLPRVIGANEMFRVSLTAGGVASLFITIVLFVVFVSAVQLALSVFSKSFREAQSYVTGLMFAVMLPAMYLMFVEETGAALWLYLVPVLNVLLVCREALMGTGDLVPVLITLVSLLAAGAAAFALAVRAFTSERVLFRT